MVEFTELMVDMLRYFDCENQKKIFFGKIELGDFDK